MIMAGMKLLTARSVLECGGPPPLWPSTRRRPKSCNLHPLASTLAALLLLAAFRALAAEPTDAEVQGRQLVQQLLDQRPAENYTNTGVLQIRPAHGKTTEVPVRVEINVTAINWSATYEAAVDTNRLVSLYITHGADRMVNIITAPIWRWAQSPSCPLCLRSPKLAAGETMTPFAGSDFWIADLGLEFLQWPQQKLVKKEVKRSQGCSVLESRNPNPAANGYARVVSWIDSENGGIVQAFAYDAKDQLIKRFYPEDFKKVGGQWQVGTMEMDNDLTDSRTRAEVRSRRRLTKEMTAARRASGRRTRRWPATPPRCRAFCSRPRTV